MKPVQWALLGPVLLMVAAIAHLVMRRLFYDHFTPSALRRPLTDHLWAAAAVAVVSFCFWLMFH